LQGLVQALRHSACSPFRRLFEPVTRLRAVNAIALGVGRQILNGLSLHPGAQILSLRTAFAV